MSIDLIETEEASAGRLDVFTSGARTLWFARFRRRARMLGSLAVAILCCGNGARALAPAAWAFIGGLLWLAIDWERFGWFILPSLVLFLCLGVVALIDARYLLVPDGPIVVLALGGLAIHVPFLWQDIAAHLAAAVFAFAMLRAVSWAFEKFRGYPGLGQGDARLYAIAGLWVGWDGLPTCLLVAVFSAMLAAALAFRENKLASIREPLSFGPHLALGLWLTWTIGPFIPD